MRRNDENLLVLAGADSSAPRREDALLVDALRAAQSEVELYNRIEFGTVDTDISVAARAVNDVVRLVAELLDNATRFSPPNDGRGRRRPAHPRLRADPGRGPRPRHVRGADGLAQPAAGRAADRRRRRVPADGSGRGEPARRPVRHPGRAAPQPRGRHRRPGDAAELASWCCRPAAASQMLTRPRQPLAVEQAPLTPVGARRAARRAATSPRADAARPVAHAAPAPAPVAVAAGHAGTPRPAVQRRVGDAGRAGRADPAAAAPAASPPRRPPRLAGAPSDGAGGRLGAAARPWPYPARRPAAPAAAGARPGRAAARAVDPAGTAGGCRRRRAARAAPTGTPAAPAAPPRRSRPARASAPRRRSSGRWRRSGSAARRRRHGDLRPAARSTSHRPLPARHPLPRRPAAPAVGTPAATRRRALPAAHPGRPGAPAPTAGVRTAGGPRRAAGGRDAAAGAGPPAGPRPRRRRPGRLADRGRRGLVAGQPAAEPADAGTTRSGLPKRVPQAQLVPGGVEPQGGQDRSRRTPDEVRGLLSAYHRGVQRGRTAGARPEQHLEQGDEP